MPLEPQAVPRKSYANMVERFDVCHGISTAVIFPIGVLIHQLTIYRYLISLWSAPFSSR